MINHYIEITDEYRHVLGSAEKTLKEDHAAGLSGEMAGWAVWPNAHGFKRLTIYGLMESKPDDDYIVQRITPIGIKTLEALRKSERVIYSIAPKQESLPVETRLQPTALCPEGFDAKTLEINVFDEPLIDEDDTKRVPMPVLTDAQLSVIALRRQLAIILNNAVIGNYARFLIKRAGGQ